MTTGSKTTLTSTSPGDKLAWWMPSCALLAFWLPVSVAFAKPGDRGSEPEEPASAAKRIQEEPEPSPMPPAPSSAPRRGSDLPWVKNKTSKDPLTVIRPPTGVREILEKYDIGESQLEGFFNAQPLTVAEEEVLVRILFRLPRIGLENIQKWRKPDLDFAQLTVDAKPHRLEVVPLTGRLLGVEKRIVSPELGSRLEIKHFFLARIDLSGKGKGYEALVAIRRLPKAWEEAAELDEPVSLDGIFLKAGGQTDDGNPQLIFAARRLRWHPDREIPEQHIGPDQLRLAELGLDISLLEDLRLLNKREIGDLDREPMYQLLDLAGRAPAGSLRSEPRKEFDLIPLLKEPEKHQGELMSVEGFARRITKIVVDDPDIRARFGIDHYYMIDMLINLKEKTIKFVNDKKKSKKDPAANDDSAEPGAKSPATKAGSEPDGPIFNNDYPVTLCVRELPPSLEPKDVMRELIRADVVFMKTWSYHSTYMAQFDNKKLVAPLLVGNTVYRVKPTQVYNWVSDALVGFAIATAAFIIGCVFWWFRTGDKKTQEILDDLGSRTAQPSFKGLEDAPVKPDFSGLEQAGNIPPS